MGQTKGKLPSQPPPLPPKPPEFSEEAYVDSPFPDYELVPHKAIPIGPPMSLDDFVHEHHKKFPLLAQVSDSLYGVCEDRTLMEGQTFRAHFLKKTTIVDMCLEPLGPDITIPINSSFLFSVVFNPESNLRKAMDVGYSFHSARDIMSSGTRPTFVAVENSWSGMTFTSSVERGEILAVLGVVVSKGKEKKWLKCVSISKQQEKLLEEGCIGDFTTVPSLVQLRLSDICKYVKYPAQVLMYASKNLSTPVPAVLQGHVLTMKGQRKIESVVVSAMYGNKGNYASTGIEPTSFTYLMEVFLSVEVDVQMLECPQEYRDEMTKRSCKLFENFEPSLVEKLVFDLSPVTNLTQLSLFKAIEYRKWKEGVELVQPLSVKPTSSYRPEVSITPPVGDTDSGRSSPDYEEVKELPQFPLSPAKKGSSFLLTAVTVLFFRSIHSCQ